MIIPKGILPFFRRGKTVSADEMNTITKVLSEGVNVLGNKVQIMKTTMDNVEFDLKDGGGVHIGDIPPESPRNNLLWIDTSEGEF